MRIKFFPTVTWPVACFFWIIYRENKPKINSRISETLHFISHWKQKFSSVQYFSSIETISSARRFDDLAIPVLRIKVKHNVEINQSLFEVHNVDRCRFAPSFLRESVWVGEKKSRIRADLRRICAIFKGKEFTECFRNCGRAVNDTQSSATQLYSHSQPNWGVTRSSINRFKMPFPVQMGYLATKCIGTVRKKVTTAARICPISPLFVIPFSSNPLHNLLSIRSEKLISTLYVFVDYTCLRYSYEAQRQTSVLSIRRSFYYPVTYTPPAKHSKTSAFIF